MQVRPDGETDITTVFGTVGPSSILGRGTYRQIGIETARFDKCTHCLGWGTDRAK